MFKKLSTKFNNKDVNKTLIWEHDYDPNASNRSMIYRFPNAKYSNITKIKYIGVRDYETALYYKNGKYVGSLDGGHYEIEKDAKNPATEIVWFDPSIVKLTWGISHSSGASARTMDGFVIGASGDLTIQIEDAEALITNVISGKVNYSDQDFRDLINSILQASFRDVVNTFDLKGFVLSNRDDFNNRMKTVLSDPFMRYGLKIDSIQFLNIAHPIEDQLKVKEIMDITSNVKTRQLEADTEDLANKEKQLKTLKTNLDNIEMQFALGELDEQEYNSKLPRIKNLIAQ